MFFGGSNGFNAFYPDQIVDNLNPPPVFITDCSTGEQAGAHRCRFGFAKIDP